MTSIVHNTLKQLKQLKQLKGLIVQGKHTWIGGPVCHFKKDSTFQLEWVDFWVDPFQHEQF